MPAGRSAGAGQKPNFNVLFADQNSALTHHQTVLVLITLPFHFHSEHVRYAQ